jgi:APA family basic amino acid/polyamine antiporter
MNPQTAAEPKESVFASQPTLARRLTFVDSLMLLVGGIIGSAIFLTAKDIAGDLPSPLLFIGVWIVGGFISLLGCFAFAELGAMYPDAGGQYVYLREAFGDFIAFLYGWAYFGVIGSGTLAALAVGFASYTGALIPWVSSQHILLHVGRIGFTSAQAVALAVIALLTWINAWGVKRAAVVQNVATWTKYAAMGAFVILGFVIGKGSWSHFTHPMITAHAAAEHSSFGGMLSAFGVALIAVFWAYDGWVYIGQAAGEIHNPQRTLPRALIGGILMVMVIYVAMNVAYLYAIPLAQIAGGEETAARSAASALFSPGVGAWIAALVALSCFGALSAAILSTARVSYAMAVDGLFFRRMGEVHPRWRTPVFSLIVQGIWGGVLTLSGRYDQLFTYIMSMEVISYALAVVGLFILRRRRPDLPRPYRCTGYPWLPAIYIVIAIAWAVNTVWQKPTESLAGALIIAIGVPLYLYWRFAARRKATA